MRACGMGEAPRLGVRLGVTRDEDDPPSCWVLRRRRLRGRMEEVSESREAGIKVLEEELREGGIALGIFPVRPQSLSALR